MLQLPVSNPTDPVKLSDWIELYALFSPDCNSSRGDLERALSRAAFTRLENDEAVELKILETFEELEQRVKATGAAYPFDLSYGTLQLKSSWEDFPAYIFCLCLSYFGLRETKKTPKLFEQISCLAAKGYLKGDVIEFGWPRTELPSSFSDAVTEMCKRIREGGGYRVQPPLGRKDDGLDLVAWKDFADKWSSKILMFGQCAAGDDWEDKLTELQPKRFCEQWMQFSPFHPPIKSFFVPHRVGQTKWEFVARKAGIFFDRCRIASWAYQEAADYHRHLAWIKRTLRHEKVSSSF